MTRRIVTVLMGLWLIGLFSGFAAPVQAATELTWARNTESDLSHYKVYACFTKGCTVTQSAAFLQLNTIPQPAVGVRPSWPLPVGQEGTVAVSAEDTSQNESGLSVSVPFDSKAPAVPTDVRAQ